MSTNNIIYYLIDIFGTFRQIINNNYNKEKRFNLLTLFFFFL